MTFLLETLRLGLRNIALHKLRAFLTALGIICGVAAVIAMTAIGEGNKRQALADIERLGANNIIARSVKPADMKTSSGTNARRNLMIYGLKRADLRQIEATVHPIRRIIPLKQVSTSLTLGALRTPAAVYGTLPELLDLTSLRIARGRYLTADDTSEPVVVLGAEVAERLFPLSDPLLGTVRIEGQAFRVVGVLQRVGLAGGAGTTLVGRDLNFDAHIPLPVAQQRFSDIVNNFSTGGTEIRQVELDALYIEVPDQDQVPAVAQQIALVLDARHGKTGDTTLTVPIELLEQKARTQRNFNYMMIAIAAISLLVGGIGIMNIMLATVTERTREIGIRRAVGATRRHIQAQFLAETTMLSAIAGLIGIGAGVTLARVLGLWWQPRPEIVGLSVIVSFIVATAVGITFGLYPAYMASKQDPIIALRHD
ncbi:MAG: ABC transporter permease [Phycisphaeraceae bacterium]|nr:ABC transporter permease [Phycisphaeraceae bacterium]